ncbi:hypothetical protein SAMN05192583_1964 [Sphingomonas gellani]|uniref:TraB family protein n=1 Tax=Sphingomonas gellani TaxID=1166340 RepID=A0A1H8DKJ6_9SPHN|nr:DUF5694 domain-containing protein [Sphingomonas gellani]SEN07799.1 hypothetical protein SAMN05192583_1964 [Sphingomonas gellani]
MMMRGKIAVGIGLAVAALAGAAATAADYRPSFHPDRLKGPRAGPPNEVLVLGTTHLSGLPKGFRSELLTPLIERLAGWRPEAIATEDMSGLQCDMLRRYPYRYGKDTLDYCPDPTAASKATGLNVPAATAEAERLLLAWPKAPIPAQRRHLAVIFLAAGEPGSALVQWLRLAPSERQAGDGLTADLVGQLERRRTSRNETNLISAPLAAMLGLERLWSVDDHSADASTPPEQEKPYEAAITRAWDNPVTKQRAAWDETLTAGVSEPGGLLALYRAYNSPRAQAWAFQSDFGATMNEPSPERFGRGYLAYWEVRNLRMVANIRDVLGRKPGTRLLAIVGASHKGYYEAYLNQMHDVRLVDAARILR